MIVLSTTVPLAVALSKDPDEADSRIKEAVDTNADARRRPFFRGAHTQTRGLSVFSLLTLCVFNLRCSSDVQP
jgi:hypothetical protein